MFYIWPQTLHSCLLNLPSCLRCCHLQATRLIMRKLLHHKERNVLQASQLLKMLEKCDPPMQVDDLLTDIRDGKILMALLEELSGCKMLYRFRPSTNYIFSLNNIVKALDFLEDRNVKVVNVEAADIADGRSSVVLGLIWNIIVSFQLKEVTGNLEKRFSSLSSLASLPKSDSSACSSPAPPSVEQSDTHLSKSGGLSSQPKYRSKAITALLNWANMSTSLYGVEVCDFSESWRDGLAFLALVKCAKPELVDMNAALSTSPRQNLTDVFTLAEQSLGIPALLQKEDMMVCSPDEQSVITYVAQFLKYFQDKDRNLFCLPWTQMRKMPTVTS
ncbi:calmin [Brachyhypopomus gauderio]|uniref:calmin n=1 Tax=Brachyhypopomus gauderio TaxID=698409 RepID=UPI0040416921